MPSHTRKSPASGNSTGLCHSTSRFSVPVRQYPHVLAATMLIDDPLTGLLIYFVSLTAGFGQIFRRGFVAVAEQNHRLVKWIGTFVKFVGRDADNLALFKLMGFVAPLHD